MLFNEPKLLKFADTRRDEAAVARFSALQRAEIAEIHRRSNTRSSTTSSFSALQRAEIAEIDLCHNSRTRVARVSVLFNEPKLLKFRRPAARCASASRRFSALQRAEIAEILDFERQRKR